MARTAKFDGRAAKQFHRLGECSDDDLGVEFNKLCGMLKSKDGALLLIDRQPGKPATKIRRRLVQKGLV